MRLLDTATPSPTDMGPRVLVQRTRWPEAASEAAAPVAGSPQMALWLPAGAGGVEGSPAASPVSAPLVPGLSGDAASVVSAGLPPAPPLPEGTLAAGTL